MTPNRVKTDQNLRTVTASISTETLTRSEGFGPQMRKSKIFRKMSGPNASKPEHEFDVVVASGLMRAISLISEPSEESTDVIPDRRVIYENGLARRKVSRPLRFFDLRKNIAKGGS